MKSIKKNRPRLLQVEQPLKVENERDKDGDNKPFEEIESKRKQRTIRS